MEQGTPRRIGCLGAWADEPARDPAHAAWLSGLREKGWIEGKNLLVEYRCAPDRKPSMKEPAGNGRRWRRERRALWRFAHNGSA